jgi:hypothetical protein
MHPGSELKLGSVTSIQRLCAGQAVQPFVLAVLGCRSDRHRAWVRVALRNGTQWKTAGKTWSRAGNDARTGEGTGRFNDLNITEAVVQALLFGGGGLIHAAVGLSGGVERPSEKWGSLSLRGYNIPYM